MLSKNRLYFYYTAFKAEIAVALMVPIGLGLLCSRAILSVSIIVFGVNGLRGLWPKDCLKDKYWMLGIVWLAIMAASWWWTDDKALWRDHLQVKLPILLLPLAFLGIPRLTKVQVVWLASILAATFILGSAWSLSFLLRNSAYYLQGYSVSHILPTPMYNDHVSFSVGVALCTVTVLYAFPFLSKNWQKGLAIGAIFFFVAYMHILAARAGLVCLYLFFGLKIIYQLWKGRYKTVLISSVAVVVFGWLAIQYVPTLQSRWGYMKYTLAHWQDGNRDVNYNDAGRIISYKMAVKALQNNWLFGAGAGDMREAMSEQYAIAYPDVAPEKVLLPHNEFLIVTLAAGVFCLLFFIAWIFQPLLSLKRNQESFYFVCIWVMLLIPLLVDPFLEVQYGLSVYLTFLLWHRHLMLNPAK